MKQFIPEKSLEYVFFNELANVDLYSATESEAFLSKANQIQFSNNNIPSSAQISVDEKIKQAIAFLEQARDAQHAAEKRTIAFFINKIKNQFPNHNVPPELDDTLKEIENILPEDLVRWINLIRQKTDDYQRRLQELNKQLDRTKSIELMAQKEASAFLLSQNVDFTGNPADRKLDVFMGIEENKETKQKTIKTDTLTLKNEYKTIYNILTSIFDPEIKFIVYSLASKLPKNFQLEKILYTAIFLDLSRYLENIGQSIQSFLQETSSKMQTDIQAYKNKGTFFTQLLNFSDQASLNQLLEIAKNLETQLNVQVHTLKKSRSKTSGTTFFKNQIAQSKKINRWKLNVQSLSKWIPKAGEYTTIKMFTPTSQGNFYETITTLFSNALNIKGNAGTDVLFYSGQLTIDSHKLLKDIESKISKDFSEQQGILLHQSESQKQQDKSMKAQIDTQKKLNNDIKTTIETYLKSIEETNKIINDFISYDTMKMYQREDKELEGRDMQLLPALAKISAINNSSTITFNDIYPFVLNMSKTTIPGASGSEIHDQLENYLSYFAALLMFDNLEGIFSPTIQVENSSIDQLYLYNFQGRFYPMSVILNKIINNFQALQSGEINSLGVQTKLTQTEPKFPGVEKYRAENTWIEQKNQTIQNTRIKIVFAASFATWLRDLFNS